MNEIDLIKKFSELVKYSGNKTIKVDNKLPNVFIIGCPRSGTTALLQYLASTNIFAYPTNCLTRFAYSMEFATIIQELMFNQEFGLIQDSNSLNFESNYGRSQGAQNTNEFFHFYRRFFPNNEIGHLSEVELNNVDVKGLNRELSTLNDFYKKPFVSKGLMMQSNLDFFSKVLSKPIFIYIKRNHLFVMQSIYKARLKENHNAEKWWSFKPKEYENLRTKNIFEQIAGQVYYINEEIEQKLKKIPEESKLIINYESFVENPMKLVTSLSEKMLQYGFEADLSTFKTNALINGNVKSLDSQILNSLALAYNSLDTSLKIDLPE
jgi:hypothetical protein